MYIERVRGKKKKIEPLIKVQKRVDIPLLIWIKLSTLSSSGTCIQEYIHKKQNLRFILHVQLLNTVLKGGHIELQAGTDLKVFGSSNCSFCLVR